jgi:hypothetical protein
MYVGKVQFEARLFHATYQRRDGDALFAVVDVFKTAFLTSCTVHGQCKDTTQNLRVSCSMSNCDFH